MSRPPKWVQDLPNSNTNKGLLTQLAKASSKPLDTPREMNFDIRNFNDLTDAQAAAKQVEQRGWFATIDADHNFQESYWLGAKKNDYILAKDTLTDDEEYFKRLASLYGATYDGWYASVV